MIKTEFPKGLQATLHIGSKVLEVYQNNDLHDAEMLDNLSDYWFMTDFGNMYDLNVYYNGQFYILTMYETYQNDKEEYVTNTQTFIDIELKVDND